MLISCLLAPSVFFSDPQYEGLVIVDKKGAQLDDPRQAQADTEAKKAQVSKITKTVFYTILAIEIILFIWAIILAFRCGRKRNDLAIHLFVAFFLPLFYIIYYYLSECRM